MYACYFTMVRDNLHASKLAPVELDKKARGTIDPLPIKLPFEVDPSPFSVNKDSSRHSTARNQKLLQITSNL